jgi:hypothetical protein
MGLSLHPHGISTNAQLMGARLSEDTFVALSSVSSAALKML